MSEVIIREQLQSRRLPCRLEDWEIDDKCKDLAGALEIQAEAEQVWADRKEAVKIAKEAVDTAAGRVRAIGGVINSGTETQPVDCQTILDFGTHSVVTRRIDTGQVVAIRAMSQDEAQSNLYEEGRPADPDDVREAVRVFRDRGGEEAGRAPDDADALVEEKETQELAEAIEDLRPDADSGYDAVELTQGGVGVRLNADGSSERIESEFDMGAGEPDDEEGEDE